MFGLLVLLLDFMKQNTSITLMNVGAWWWMKVFDSECWYLMVNGGVWWWILVLDGECWSLLVNVGVWHLMENNHIGNVMNPIFTELNLFYIVIVFLFCFHLGWNHDEIHAALWKCDVKNTSTERPRESVYVWKRKTETEENKIFKYTHMLSEMFTFVKCEHSLCVWMINTLALNAN